LLYRLIKAQYLLDYIDDASLRQYVQRALNRGEACHFLTRAIASVNRDQRLQKQISLGIVPPQTNSIAATTPWENLSAIQK
jgi:TnpA family transposase